MTLQQASSLPPNKAVDKPDLLLSRKRLQYLTKAAVDKACKMQVESRPLVHIVDIQRCGSSSGLKLSNPFSSLSSAVMKRTPPSPSPSSRQWSLSRGSSERRTVAARIHSLLIEWKADPSLEWRARVASAVPVLEEALYKGAKSKEEYTNTQLLESQLMHVLRQFESGNGPFLLQGCTPPYSARASSSSGLPSAITSPLSPFRQNTPGHSLATGKGIFERAAEQRCSRARVSCMESSASTSGLSSTMPSPNVQEIVNLGEADSKGESLHNHEGNRIVGRVVNMLAKTRRESNVSLKHSGLSRAEDGEGKANASTSAASRQGHVSSCSRDEGRRRTLGGMLQLNMTIESTEQGLPCIDAEEASLARTRTHQETRDVGTPPLLVSDEECSNMSVTTEVVLESSDITVPIINHEQGAHCGQRSINPSSLSSPLSFIPVSSSSFSASSSSSLTPCFTASVIQSSSLQVRPSSPKPAPRLVPPSAPSTLNVLSSSPPEQQGAYIWAACPNSSPQQRSECQPQQLVTLSTELDAASQVHITREPNNYTMQIVPQIPEPRPQVELQRATTQTASEPRAEANRGTSSMNSLQSSNEVPSKSRERGLKLPLGSFLAERDDYKGYVTRYLDGGYPWETWEETTEQLDGMCCVCMVGLKGAAFIPCGHTFCRKCSRELWRGRGTCPLCNRYIREILDIY